MMQIIPIFFSKETLYKFIVHVIFTMIILVTLQLFTFKNEINMFCREKVNSAESIISRLDGKLKVTPENMCTIVGCDYIVKANKSTNAIKSLPLTYKQEIIIDGKKYIIIMDQTDDFKIFSQDLSTSTTLFFILMIGIFIRNIYFETTASVLLQHKRKHELEDKLQRVISESAHHEMMLPVATIKTLSKRIQKISKPCILMSKQECCCNGNDDRCDTGRSINVLEDYFQRIDYAIQQLEVVLSQMASSKQMRHSNGNKNIKDLIENIVNNIKVFNVSKGFTVIFNDSTNILTSYSVGKPLGNADILNYLNNHINNSIEAKATKITVRATVKEGKMSLYISDNGIGIRDKYGNIITNLDIANSIFDAGISNKDEKGNIITLEKFEGISVQSIIKSISESIHARDTTSRGVGMYINKQSLRSAGGDLILIETSERGTTFCLKFNVEKKK